jgi:hypothetical protein
MRRLLKEARELSSQSLSVSFDLPIPIVPRD